MPRSLTRRSCSVLMLLGTLAACRTAREPAPVAATDMPRRHTEADAAFMRRMIAHHGQALEMTSLVPARTERPELRLLAERVEVSQESEIALMRQWLARRGETPPAAGAHDAHHAGGDRHAPMPGMLTPEEMEELRAARGARFDRRFLELMIRHHEGALTMVAELLASRGAAQEAETFRFAADVEADQQAEIQRMRALLARLEQD